jgi:succinate dehydrogenase/fumarate reductase flavoprotein subunit/uncharacterized protein with FMN-binding domain
MKREKISRREFLRGAAASAAGAAVATILPASLSASAEEAAAYTPGTYTASAVGVNGDVTVTMTFDETSITEVIVDASGETETIGGAAADELVNQIMTGQTSEIDGVSGATVTSNAVKKAAAQCIAEAKGVDVTPLVETEDNGLMSWQKKESEKWAFEVAPDPIPDDQISEVITHDVIVIGAGMSGLCCACSAQKYGADVMLFSASSVPYARGGSNHAIGSKYQKQLGIDYTPASASKMVKVEQVSGTYHMNKQTWANWVNNSAESMDFMIDIMEEQGLHVGLEAPYYDPDDVITTEPGSHNFYSDEQPFGVFFGAPLSAQAYADHFTQNGGEIMYNVTAKQLIREDNNTGRVSGVIAQRQSDGAYIKFVANKAVVMATGDFSTDRDMMAKYSPWVYNHFKDKFSWETNYDNQFVYTGLMPGDGQKMGLWIGAAWQRTYPNPCAINGGASGPAHAVISNFWGINLDINGRRFMNECTNFAYAGMAVLDLPEETAFAVWSQDYAYTEEEWDALGSVTDGGNGIPQSTPEDMIASWDENYTKADTLEELIDILYDGYSDEAKATALQSIANYTQYAKNGYDEEFQVNPEVLHPIENGPFYGTKTVGSTFLAVFGGLRTNDKCQVCEEDDTPIEGLYNVGTMIGDFYSNSYNFVLPGQNLGACCCTLPYLVGKRLGTEE